MVDVTVEARNDADNPGLVKFSGETWELNIWATPDELWTLAGIEKTDWVQRRTLKVSTCAGLSTSFSLSWESRQKLPCRPSAPRSSRDQRTLL